jgi:hypothetical protein
MQVCKLYLKSFGVKVCTVYSRICYQRHFHDFQECDIKRPLLLPFGTGGSGYYRTRGSYLQRTRKETYHNLHSHFRMVSLNMNQKYYLWGVEWNIFQLSSLPWLWNHGSLYAACHSALLVECSGLHGLVACLAMLFGVEWTQWIERGRQVARYGASSLILSAILSG